MSNTYHYGIHQALTPPQLFYFILVDEVCEQVGMNDIEGVILILSGLPIPEDRIF